jgi:hypothetical protein
VAVRAFEDLLLAVARVREHVVELVALGSRRSARAHRPGAPGRARLGDRAGLQDRQRGVLAGSAASFSAPLLSTFGASEASVVACSRHAIASALPGRFGFAPWPMTDDAA